jgi:hypothetical protein
MRKDPRKFGEVFTPQRTVDEMLDALDPMVWVPGHVFVETGCGDGAFVLPIVQRIYKQTGHLAYALNSVFGFDIQKKNVDACRHRLLAYVYTVTQDLEFIYYAMAVIGHHISRRDSLKSRSIPVVFELLPGSTKVKKIAAVKRANSWPDIVAHLTDSQ